MFQSPLFRVRSSLYHYNYHRHLTNTTARTGGTTTTRDLVISTTIWNDFRRRRPRRGIRPLSSINHPNGATRTSPTTTTTKTTTTTVTNADSELWWRQWQSSNRTTVISAWLYYYNYCDSKATATTTKITSWINIDNHALAISFPNQMFRIRLQPQQPQQQLFLDSFVLPTSYSSRRYFSSSSTSTSETTTTTTTTKTKLSPTSTPPSPDNRNHVRTEDIDNIVCDKVTTTTTTTKTTSREKSFWDQLQSPPNIITVTRMISTPILTYWVITGQHWYAIGGCTVAAISDYLDGYLAKNYGWKTILGTYLDPIADKVFINTIALGLWYTGIFPTPIILLWATKDIILLSATAWVLYQKHGSISILSNSVSQEPLKVTPSTIAKINTTLQFTTLVVGLVLPILPPGVDALDPFLPTDAVSTTTTTDLLHLSPNVVLDTLLWTTAGTTIGTVLSYGITRSGMHDDDTTTPNSNNHNNGSNHNVDPPPPSSSSSSKS